MEDVLLTCKGSALEYLGSTRPLLRLLVFYFSCESTGSWPGNEELLRGFVGRAGES